MEVSYLVGIDEAGRGPLAGPVAVGAVLVPQDFDWGLIRGVRDSKQLSPNARERTYREAVLLERKGALRFAVAFASARSIDRIGIVPSIRTALASALRRVGADPLSCRVLLDGSLAAPSRFLRQETIIRGDATEPVISLASIVAKVERDRLMQRYARTYPNWGFEVHMGYGTAAHRMEIARQGLTPLHRASFCTRLARPVSP